MRANIETLLQNGWGQVTTLSGSVTDNNIVKLKWLLEKLPEAEDLLLTYRLQSLNAARLTAEIAVEADTDIKTQKTAELRRSQKYAATADARIEIILYEYGKL